MEISVIVPVYNDADGIRRLLPALCEQKAGEIRYEIIIVDNGSNDNTLETAQTLAASYKPDEALKAIRVAQEVEQRGSYAARNAGIAMADGEILAFTDADCLPTHDWLYRGYQAAKDLKVELVAGRIEMTFRSAKPNIMEYLDAAQELNQERYVEETGFGATANLFVRAELFERCGLFRSDLISGGDYEFCHRAGRAGAKIIYAPDAVVYHPARATLAAKLRKTKRVAKGQKQLAALGLLKHARLTWRRWLPSPWCPALKDVPIAWPKRIAVYILYNVMRYYSGFHRL